MADAPRSCRDDSLWARTAGAELDAPALTGEAGAELIIVGGGFTGCTAALEAARNGMQACVLEAETIGYGGSGRNVGLVNAGLWMPPDEVERILGEVAGQRLNEVLSRAPDAVFSLIEIHRIQCEANRRGTLHCAHGPSGLQTLQRRFGQLRARGAPVSLIDAPETAARTGCHRYRGALLDPRAGTVQPLAYVRGIARAAREAGAVIFERSRATGIERTHDGWRVHTARGSVRGEAVLLATNAYHEALDTDAAPRFTTVHYFQLATAPLGEDLHASVLPGREGCWDTATVMSSFRKDAAGRLLIGGIGALQAGWSSIHTDWAQRKLHALFPQVGEATFEHAWHGRIAMTRDHLPRVVRIGPRAVSVYGYSGRGIGPGTVFGTAAARYLQTGDPGQLPVPVTESHEEPLTALREALVEAGASAFHLGDSR